MKATSINPFSWHEADDQCVVVESVQRIAFVSGQTAMSEDGEPQHPNDMRSQTALTLDNVETVLLTAGMDFSNVVRLDTHTTDVDGFLSDAAQLMAERLGEYGVRPPGVLSGVVRLGLPELLVEIDVTAVA